MDFFEHFGFERTPEAEELLKLAEKDFAEKGDEVYGFERHGIFTYTAEHIRELAEEAKKDKRNAVYCYMLHRALEKGDRATVRNISQPGKKGESETLDFLPMFGILLGIDKMVEGLRSRGVDEDVIFATKDMFENQLGDFILLNHHYGISDYVSWLNGFLECRLIRVGRFNFENRTLGGKYTIFKNGDTLLPAPDGVKFHRSGRVFGSIDCTDEEGSFETEITENENGYTVYRIENGLGKNEKMFLKKSEWEKFLCPSDKVIEFHIPSGGPLEYESNTADLLRGYELMNRCFGGGFKAFHGHSWLFEPMLAKVIGKVTNITRFNDRLTFYPAKSDGKEVFEYLYNLAEVPPLEQLEEKSSFQRSVKQYLLAGNHFYGGHSIMLPPKQGV